MKSLIVAVAVLFAAIILVATKPTPEEIAEAALGKINFVVVNRNSMPKDFLAAVAASAIIEGIGQLLHYQKPPEPAGPLRWKINDLIFLRYSDLSLANVGSLKCLWLLRSGYCAYSAA